MADRETSYPRRDGYAPDPRAKPARARAFRLRPVRSPGESQPYDPRLHAITTISPTRSAVRDSRYRAFVRAHRPRSHSDRPMAARWSLLENRWGWGCTGTTATAAHRALHPD